MKRVTIDANTRAQIMEVLEQNAAENPLWWARLNRRMLDGSRYEILKRGRWYMPYLHEPLSEWTPGAPKGHRQVWAKAAQVGVTEAAINVAFWFLFSMREGVMYGLPSEDQITSFVQVRINPVIRNSPRIARAVKNTDNTDVKLVYGRPLYFRGSIARSKLREIPVGMLIRDEFSEMSEEGREIMVSRLGGSSYKWILDVGNPTFYDTGIDKEYREGDQSTWRITCEKCGAKLEPVWPESIAEKDGVWRLVCAECGAPIDKTQGEWVPENPGAPYRSFRVSQLASPSVEPWEVVRAWELAQGNPTRLQEFYNSVLGLPYAPEGTKITDRILASLPRLGEMWQRSEEETVMGVDVGTVLHVTIRLLEGGIIWAGECTWEDLPQKIGAYNVVRCGIDIAPETTLAKRFALRFPGRVVLIRYLSSAHKTAPKEIVEDGIPILAIPKTLAVDESIGRILLSQEPITNLPKAWFSHMKAPVRQIVKSRAGEYAAWVESGPDHFFHSFVMSELVRQKETPWERIGLYL